ncbi:immunoglobulin domain-containing protein [bacterium]|nr:immunoglobulin domain-containing protein [bacterium]
MACWSSSFFRRHHYKQHSCIAGAIPPPGPVVSEVGGKNSGVKYQWFKDGSPIPGKNSPTLILDKATEYHAGNYQLLATEKGVSHFSKEIPVTIVESLKPLVDHRK